MKRLVIIALLVPLFPGFGQQPIDIEEHINKLIMQGDDSRNSNYYDLLIYYYDNPIDLNKTDGQALLELGLLTHEQVQEIINHRQHTGPFQSIYELQTLAGFTPEVIHKIAPFITAGSTETLGAILKKLPKSRSNYLALGYSRLFPTAQGFVNGAYSGSPDRAQLRWRMRYPGRLSIGITAQKDPGEAWLRNTAIPSPDYLSAHVYLEDQGRLQQLAIGDYRLQFGQGLVLGAGFMVGKNTETVTSVKQATLGVIPYTSITETRYLRGSALTLQLARPWRVSLFYSNQNLDATVADSAARIVTGIRTSGLHRTASERAGRGRLNEQVWGGAVTYRQGAFAGGVVLMNTLYDQTIRPPDRLYNYYRFSGRQALNYSWFGQYEAGGFMFFSEIARTHNRGTAVNAGLLGSLNAWADVSLLYRHFDPGFYSFYGLAFSERSVLGNENGFYWGLRLYPAAGTVISAYADMYRFPWLTAATAAPTNGLDYMVRIDQEINDNNRFYLQGRFERAARQESTGPVYTNSPASLLKLLANFDLNTEMPLWFRLRLQYNRYRQQQNEQGWLFYQELNYSRRKLGLSLRLLLFDTDSYNARQYAYERDMLFSYVTRVFAGRGMSYYLLLRYKPIRHLTCRLKWSYTHYADRNQIGSGNDTLPGNERTQLTAQLYYSF